MLPVGSRISLGRLHTQKSVNFQRWVHTLFIQTPSLLADYNHASRVSSLNHPLLFLVFCAATIIVLVMISPSNVLILTRLTQTIYSDNISYNFINVLRTPNCLFCATCLHISGPPSPDYAGKWTLPSTRNHFLSWCCLTLVSWQGRSCLELGSGSGLCGIALINIGAQSITLSDGNEAAIQNCEHNVALNCPDHSSQAS